MFVITAKRKITRTFEYKLCLYSVGISEYKGCRLIAYLFPFHIFELEYMNNFKKTNTMHMDF